MSALRVLPELQKPGKLISLANRLSLQDVSVPDAFSQVAPRRVPGLSWVGVCKVRQLSLHALEPCRVTGDALTVVPSDLMVGDLVVARLECARLRCVDWPSRCTWVGCRYFRWPLSLEAAAAFWSPFFSAGVWWALGLQLPFSPCFLPGVGSKPGQQALALEDFLPVDDFFALFLPGVLWVSAPVMCFRRAAVSVLAVLVAPRGGVFLVADFLAVAFLAGAFFADWFGVFLAAFFAGADLVEVGMGG